MRTWLSRFGFLVSFDGMKSELFDYFIVFIMQKFISYILARVSIDQSKVRDIFILCKSYSINDA